jgi:hypothetical protein
MLASGFSQVRGTFPSPNDFGNAHIWQIACGHIAFASYGQIVKAWSF